MPIARMLRFAELARGSEETVAERLALLEAHDRAIGEKISGLRAHQEQIRRKIRVYRAKRWLPEAAGTEA
jgi:hypothetical protein